MKKKLRVYFLEPNYRQHETPGFDEFMEPLNLCYLAAAAKKEGHEVTVKQQFDNTNEKIAEDIAAFNPDVLAVTVITMFFNRAVNIVAKVKSYNKNIITVAGGAHPSGDPEEVARYFDYVIAGEGENSFIKLLNELPENRKPDLPRVGFYYKKHFYFNSSMLRLCQFNELPFREGLDFSKYTGNGNGPVPVPARGFASMLLSRGCRFNCTFCVNKLMWGVSGSDIIPVVKRPPVDVVFEMEMLNKIYDVGYVWFQDPDFPLYDRSYVKDFCKLKIEKMYTLKYSFMTRIDNIFGSDENEAADFLKLLKMSGCHMIGLGIESFSHELLKKVKKSMSFEKTKRTLELIYNAGIIPVAFFIIGFPDDTKERIEQTYEIAKKLKILRYRFSIFYPFKGTSKNIVSENDWAYPEAETYDMADNQHEVIKTNLPAGQIQKYFKSMNSDIYFEREYSSKLNEFYEKHVDMRSTIENWKDQIDLNYKVEN